MFHANEARVVTVDKALNEGEGLREDKSYTAHAVAMDHECGEPRDPEEQSLRVWRVAVSR